MSQRTTQSLERAISILFAFRHEAPLLTIDQIAAATNIPKSSCYRLITTLRKHDLVQPNRESGGYRLGLGVLKLHSILLDSLDIGRIAFPFLRELSQKSGETAQLVLRNSDVGVCIEKVESAKELVVRPDRGTVIGLHSGASGKAILAYMDPSEQERIIKEKGLKKIGPETITDSDRLSLNLKQIKKQGYAISDQELYAGVKAVAAPIFGADGNVIASVCIAAPRERFDQKEIGYFAEPVKLAARSISKALGYQDMEQTPLK
jgi:DNA-binding IclR family transcriptional regulator